MKELRQYVQAFAAEVLDAFPCCEFSCREDQFGYVIQVVVRTADRRFGASRAISKAELIGFSGYFVNGDVGEKHGCELVDRIKAGLKAYGL